MLKQCHRLLAVFFALFTLLSMQVAVAGYACPAESKPHEATSVAHAGMPCAGEMELVDSEQPGLCHAHCQAEESSDKLSSPLFLGEVSGGFSYTVHAALVTEHSPREQLPFLSRATAPPISVRNCCFRL